LNKLVERMTEEKVYDLKMRFIFLLTYRTFTSPK